MSQGETTGPIIAAEGISKTFRIYRNPLDRLREAFSRRRLHHEHVALHDVAFSLAAGEAMAFIGRNGAGKSTLLKIVTGIMLPDTTDCGPSSGSSSWTAFPFMKLFSPVT